MIRNIVLFCFCEIVQIIKNNVILCADCSIGANTIYYGEPWCTDQVKRGFVGFMVVDF